MCDLVEDIVVDVFFLMVDVLGVLLFFVEFMFEVGIMVEKV